MLDVLDFIAERGGNPEKIKESQRKRYAPVEVVDEIIALWQEHRTTLYSATRRQAEINEVQKQIAPRKKAKESIDDLLQRKRELEAEKKGIEDAAAEKEKELNAKLKTVGNIIRTPPLTASRPS